MQYLCIIRQVAFEFWATTISVKTAPLVIKIQNSLNTEDEVQFSEFMEDNYRCTM